MKYTGTNYTDTKKVGDSIWACEYAPTDNKEGKSLWQTPIKGEFTTAQTKELNEKEMQKYANSNDLPHIRFFVPYKKNGELAWSKAVRAIHRSYADTYDECVELYNEKMDSYIQFHEKIIDEIKALKIK